MLAIVIVSFRFVLRNLLFLGTSLFLHWLVGMVFVFYFASFVLLLREVGHINAAAVEIFVNILRQLTLSLCSGDTTRRVMVSEESERSRLSSCSRS